MKELMNNDGRVEKQYFYILAYPRSRTTWFSVFMSTPYTSCEHELLSAHDPDNVHVLLNSPRLFSGSADTNPVSVIKLPCPPGPVLIIRRKKENVVNSMINCFIPPRGLTGDDWRLFCKNLVDYYEVALDFLEQYGKGILTVKFEDLEHIEVLKAIWSHLIPEPQFMPEDWYFKEWNGMRITVKKRDLTENLEATNAIRGITWEQGIKNTLEFDAADFREKFEKIVIASMARKEAMADQIIKERQRRILLMSDKKIVLPGQPGFN